MPQKAKVPLNNIWAKDWNQTPTYPNIQSTDYMKKILVYYPKNLNALNPITLTNEKKPDVHIHNHPSHSLQKSLYRKISFRYKNIYFKNLNLNGLTSPKNPVPNSIKALKISPELPTSRFKPPLSLRKLLKNNKKISSLDISPIYQTPASLIKYLRFQRSLNSLLINSFPSLTCQQYKRLLFTSKNTLKTLTITGYIPNEYMDKSNRFTSLLEAFFDLPSLERFRLEAKVSDDFDFNRVPFAKLQQQQRNIKFDIRLGHSTEKLSLTDKNASLMKQLDFLGINMRERWPSLLFEHDKVQKNHLKAQQQAKNLLFLNVSQMKCLILLDLFSVCQNIRTLDLILSEENSAVMDFSGLHKLHNLQHLFIKLHAFDDTPTNLLESLVLYSQRNQTLESISFQFFKGTISEDYSQLLPFWENCASTVEKVILQFSHTDANHGDIELFYKGLDKLTKLKSLTVLINGMSFLKAHLDLFLSHYSLLTNILADKLALEELHFSAPHIDTRCLNLNFPANNKAIKSFGVSLGTTELNKSLLRNILSLPGLQMLELNLPALYEDEWVKIFKILRSMRAMEIVKIRAMIDWNDESNSKMLKSDIRNLMDQHPALKLMMFESEDCTELQVFRKECLWNDMREFISKNYFQNHKVLIDGQFSFY